MCSQGDCFMSSTVSICIELFMYLLSHSRGGSMVFIILSWHQWLLSARVMVQVYGGIPVPVMGPRLPPFSRLYAILRLHELSLPCLLPLISVQLLTGKTLAPALHGNTAV